MVRIEMPRVVRTPRTVGMRCCLFVLRDARARGEKSRSDILKLGHG